MTEKEMIEEMAKILDECCNYYDENGNHLGNKCRSCEHWCDTNNLCCSYNKKEAEALYNAGYRKIPEGWVVLTSEQYSNYLILQTNEEWLKNKATELQADNERLYKNLGKFKESVRKETAKEIFEKVLSYIGSNQKFCIVDNDNQTLIDCDKLWEFVGILAKQYGVEE